MQNNKYKIEIKFKDFFNNKAVTKKNINNFIDEIVNGAIINSAYINGLNIEDFNMNKNMEDNYLIMKKHLNKNNFIKNLSSFLDIFIEQIIEKYKTGNCELCKNKTHLKRFNTYVCSRCNDDFNLIINDIFMDESYQKEALPFTMNLEKKELVRQSFIISKFITNRINNSHDIAS